MRHFAGLDDVVAASGEHLGTGDWVVVDQARIDGFAEATGDFQWIHTDPARAADGPYGATIAHGYLTLSLLPMLVGQLYRIDGARMGVNYGLDRVRFLNPVRVGSRVRADSELRSATPVGADAVQLAMRTTIEIEGQAKPACVADHLSRYYR